MTMVERVARAIFDSWVRNPPATWEDAHPDYKASKMHEARAAIKAMTPPSDAMCDEGYHAQPDSEFRETSAVYRAMIDAALSETETTR